MGNKVFLDLSEDENLKKMNIDPLLVDSFKRVMIKIQEYFDANGYTDEIDFNSIVKEYIMPRDVVDKDTVRSNEEFITSLNSAKKAYNDLEKLFGAKLPPFSDEDYLLNYIQKNYNVGLCITVSSNSSGFYDNYGQYEPSVNQIIINKASNVFNSDDLDRVLCHEFIHCLTMCGSPSISSVSDEMPSVMFEPITEMISSEIIGEGIPHSYRSFCKIIKYMNKISGVNDYSSFLNRKLDSRYNSFTSVIDLMDNAFNKGSFNEDRKYGVINKEDMESVLTSITSELVNRNYSGVDDLIDNLIHIYTLKGDLSIDTIKNIQEVIVKSYLSKNRISDEITAQKIMQLLEVKNTRRLIDGREFSTIDIDGTNYYVDRNGGIYYHDENVINKLSFAALAHDLNNETLLIGSGSTFKGFDLSSMDFSKLGDSLEVKQEQLEREISLLIGGKKLNRPYIKQNVISIIESRDKAITPSKQEYKKKLERPYINPATKSLLEEKIKSFEFEKERKKLLSQKNNIQQIMTEQQLLANQQAVMASLEEQDEQDMSMGM